MYISTKNTKNIKIQDQISTHSDITYCNLRENGQMSL